MNSIDLCNISLALVGVDRGIQALSDDSPEARYCNTLYSQVLQSLLRNHPWRWASKRVALALLTDTSPEWDYIYGYPTDCLKLLSVEDAVPVSSAQYEYEVRALTGSDIGVCCNVEEAYARYTKNVTDANLFDPAFCDALTTRLSSRLALSLQGQTGVASAMAQEADRALARAKFLDASEGHQEPYRSSSYLDARTA